VKLLDQLDIGKGEKGLLPNPRRIRNFDMAPFPFFFLESSFRTGAPSLCLFKV
jgi:hypothetical protein